MKHNGKVFWLINQYGSTPCSGFGGRLFYIAKELVAQGHTVFLIIDRSHHLLSTSVALPKNEIVDGINIVRIDTLKYKGAHSSKRVFTWFIFSLKLLFINKNIKTKPDVVISSSPSPFVGLAGVCLSKFYKAKSVFDIRDMWPLTLTTLGGVSKRHPLIWLMSKAEKVSLKYSNIVSSNLPNAQLRISEVIDCEKPFLWLPNGFDETEVSMPEELSLSIKEQLPDAKFILGYVGTFGLANALEPLFEAAEKIKENKDIAIVLAGGGELEAKFKLLIKERGLINVFLLGRVPKNQVQSLISKFDACYIGWKNEELYRYGIAPNKVPEYFYSSKPVLHSYSGTLDPIKIASAGITVKAESSGDIAEGIIKLASTEKAELKIMGGSGKKYAEINYNYKCVTKRLIEGVFCDSNS